ncbi:hypothetical protein AOQ84DRAFT_27274 [Glonium stellatum]|uniref:Uncharacterized protein n=1 Tax=Glonium stellatum TaxID=574774 RepID=A0A8E2FCL1_9PEZI|nr:hypothetical protein AOQ84DRAFT_27274 [Glonium stellatum]
MVYASILSGILIGLTACSNVTQTVPSCFQIYDWFARDRRMHNDQGPALVHMNLVFAEDSNRVVVSDLENQHQRIGYVLKVEIFSENIYVGFSTAHMAN